MSTCTYLIANFIDEQCGCHATLHIDASEVQHGLTVTIIHETISDLVAYDVPGSLVSEEIRVQNQETLTIIVRDGCSDPVACGVFAVDLGLIEKYGMPLRPVLCSNLVVVPCEQEIVENAADRALSTLDHAKTAPLEEVAL